MQITRHTEEQHTQSMADFLPSDKLFRGKNIDGSNLRKILKAFAKELFRVEDTMAVIQQEHDITKTDLFISEWERAVGIPDCCIPVAATIEERRANVLLKLRASGVSTIEGFINLANTLNYTINVIPGADLGVFPLKFPIYFFPTPKSARFTVFIDVNSGFDADVFPLPFPIQFAPNTNNILECLFRKLLPANVQIIFRYTPNF